MVVFCILNGRILNGRILNGRIFNGRPRDVFHTLLNVNSGALFQK